MNAELRGDPRTRALCLTLVLVSAVVFVARGPVRAVFTQHRSGDLAPSYAASKAFLQGRDLYDPAVLSGILRVSGRELNTLGDPELGSSLYPPPTTIAVLPLAMFSWPAARVFFLCVNLVLFGYHLRALLRLGALRLSETRGLLLLAGVLAFAPYHTGIALGQLAIPCVTLLVIAIDLIKRGRDVGGGVALGVASLLKPQIAGLFLLYFLARRRWRPTLIACGIGAVATVGSVGWLRYNGIDWWHSWLASTGVELRAGGGIDPLGPVAASMIDARMLLAVVGVDVSAWITTGIGAVIGVGLFVLASRLPRESELLVLAAVAVWALLIFYHRFYDASLLSLPLAWAASRAWVRDGLTRLTSAAALCCAVFFVPGQVALDRLAGQGTFPAWLIESPLWPALAIRHQAWALAALFAVLVAAIVKSAPRPAVA